MPELDPVAIGVIGSAIASFFTLATIISNAIITRMRESRQRKWDIEDRAEEARKAKTRAEDIQNAIAENTEQTKVAAQAAVSSQKITIASGASLHKAIAENTAKTEEATAASAAAHAEANDVNKKLVALGLRMQEDSKAKSTKTVVVIEKKTDGA